MLFKLKVYEMALSGWSFHVLSPIFTIHWGMQMKQRRPSWRKIQMDRNRRLFDVIHHELKAKYGLLNKSPVHWHPKPLPAKPAVLAKSAVRTSVWSPLTHLPFPPTQRVKCLWFIYIFFIPIPISYCYLWISIPTLYKGISCGNSSDVSWVAFTLS